ncbi:MAG: type II toxin-antitoxin system PemK/MazF family toxin [Vallitaleaceae bacterium]|nr:type II toxin-antitoxin system PemK/MazF family toxin [Vallitaleaceae bacterium]
METLDQGDIISLEFDPQAGHEQRGRRPAIVISSKQFNQFTKMAIVCPITNTNRNYPLHLKLDTRTKTQGVILCEQLKSLDIYARKAKLIEKLPNDLLEELLDIVSGFY